MFLGVKTDYSLLNSFIKIKELIPYLKEHNITSCGIVDENLCGSIEFYNSCVKNGIKPIIGIDLSISNHHIYVYAKNYDGYRNLLKINSIVLKREIKLEELILYTDLIVVLPYESKQLLNSLSSMDVYIGYKNDIDKANALVISDKIVYFNVYNCLYKSDGDYYKYLIAIKEGNIVNHNITCNSLEVDLFKNQESISDLVDISIPFGNRYIPKYLEGNSYEYLVALCKKGLEKRLDGNVTDVYFNRLKYELEVINSMGFVDYFLIVYDYVKYARLNDISVGPGRGSAAGALVSYVLGITEIDPIKYGLLFERFLNPDRITMPDIDIDFEHTKRELVVDYVRNKYGSDKVAPIMTYGTLASRAAIRDIGRSMGVNIRYVDTLSKMIDSRYSLLDNSKNKKIIDYVNLHSELKDVYRVARKVEGLKRHVSTHAAGVVISSVSLDDLIPIYYNGDHIMTGVTMEYLEELGLLKMDFLALSNLTLIKSVVNNLLEDGIDIDIKKIPLNDKATLDLFCNGDTDGLFQFESDGMKNFLKKLKPSTFDMLIDAIALYRPGPMENIGEYIRLNTNKSDIKYYDNSLKKILESTNGIIVYQEQIMQILALMAGYSFAEADNIRRAMSKKKADVIENEKNKFIQGSLKNGYSLEVATNVYNLIAKFANYGFNKAHSVSYSLIGYQMAYLKSHYSNYFYVQLLNSILGNEEKTRSCFSLIKKNNLVIVKPDVNVSTSEYYISGGKLILPLISIKGINSVITKLIIEGRANGGYFDVFDFFTRVIKLGVSRDVIISLIKSDSLRCFNINKRMLLDNLDSLMEYGNLCKDLDFNMVHEPVLTYVEDDLVNYELEMYGYYISNHPVVKYNSKELVKLDDVAKYFDRTCKFVVLIDRVKETKTKKGEVMAFFSGNDDSGNMDFVIFPRQNNLLSKVEIGRIVYVYGLVTKRDANYQVVVNNIESVE